jgi:glucokinase
MMSKEDVWAIGVDLGGTKIEVAQVYASGRLRQRARLATDVADGSSAVKDQIVSAVRELQKSADSAPIGIGVGVAGQIEPDTGTVRFAPNLDWHDVRLGSDLSHTLDLPVVVTNDVRAITWGEWLHGAGRGCDDLLCLFAGTGIGGGIVSGGQMLSGCSNAAGELGHITIQMDGPLCHCGNRGCLEALAGGWAIARRAREAIRSDAVVGAPLLERAGGELEKVSAKTVAQAAHAGDPLAQKLVDEVAQALIAGILSLVNVLNPRRLILGGGVMEGLPELVGRVDRGVRERALPAATARLQVVSAQLNGDAGVVGAAALAMHSVVDKGA